MKLRAFTTATATLRRSLQHNSSNANGRWIRARGICIQSRQYTGGRNGVLGRPVAAARSFASGSLIAGSRGPQIALPAAFIAGQRRSLATVQDATHDNQGPMEEYNKRVKSGRLRDDEHQRESLQNLHDELRNYTAPAIVHPTLESLKQEPVSVFGRMFGGARKEKKLQDIPENLPRGLYLYGDVGSGKTMLMDMFYETLPSSVASKTRIHFHNFMQDVHKRLHKMKLEHGNDIDGVPFIAADIAEQGNVLCFDEFQCTDVADAMILRRYEFSSRRYEHTDITFRLLEALMSHGVVLVTTSNRHPDKLYLNGIQRESFLPCISLLKNRLHVINLDSPTDYRKIPRPPSGVYHAPLDKHAPTHAEKWFRFLGDPQQDEPRSETQTVWGREIYVPKVSGKAAMFTFDELIGRATGAADYIELTRAYDAFIVTNVPGMSHNSRDLARRFIYFIDAVYEARAKLVLTTAVPLTQLFLSREEIKAKLQQDNEDKKGQTEEGADLDDTMRMMMDDLGMNMKMLKSSNMFSGDEERFQFARALSRLSEMGSQEWVERGMGLERDGGVEEKESWQRVRSRRLEDTM
ncbi:Protein AFG1 [Lachnellula willkommii]|uniref:Protein AFG1 n=1 Tax=Lachnellula willkommii TaxID=215461 RepID=A0A559MJ90_9HELO|nr:Protein AFG1 [Lachnellula willkommii]